MTTLIRVEEEIASYLVDALECHAQVFRDSLGDRERRLLDAVLSQLLLCESNWADAIRFGWHNVSDPGDVEASRGRGSRPLEGRSHDAS